MTIFLKLLAHGALAVTLAAAALPASAASAKNACSVRDADAAIRTLVPADLSGLAAAQRLSGTAVVQFDLDSNGVAHDPAIVKSTGSPVLDADARKAALAQTYAPQIRSCEAVPGSYRVIVDFTADADDGVADR